MAKILKEQVEHPVVVAPPHALLAEAVHQDRSGFVVDGVIVRMVTGRTVVGVLYGETNTKIQPNILQSLHGLAVGVVVGRMHRPGDRFSVVTSR